MAIMFLNEPTKDPALPSDTSTCHSAERYVITVYSYKGCNAFFPMINPNSCLFSKVD